MCGCFSKPRQTILVEAGADSDDSDAQHVELSTDELKLSSPKQVLWANMKEYVKLIYLGRVSACQRIELSCLCACVSFLEGAHRDRLCIHPGGAGRLRAMP